MAIEHPSVWVVGIGSVAALAIGAVLSKSLRPDAWAVVRSSREGGVMGNARQRDILKVARTAGEAKRFASQMPGSRVEPYIVQSAVDDMHSPPSSR